MLTLETFKINRGPTSPMEEGTCMLSLHADFFPSENVWRSGVQFTSHTTGGQKSGGKATSNVPTVKGRGVNGHVLYVIGRWQGRAQSQKSGRLHYFVVFFSSSKIRIFENDQIRNRV